MIEISITASKPEDILREISKSLRGEINEAWGEETMTVNNQLATGKIVNASFDWGVNLIDLNIIFREDVIFKIHAEDFNPIRFVYNLEGYFMHRFGINATEIKTEQFQSIIFTNQSNGINYLHFPKDVKLKTNIIQIVRHSFLKKRTTNVASLNKKLYEVFVDTDHEKRFIHFGELNLRMADQVRSLHKIKSKGMLKILKMEAKVYDILSTHIQQHERSASGIALPINLNKTELKLVRKASDLIQKKPEHNYSLDKLSLEFGLSQSKLQDGFKFIHKRTVTEFIRHIRLEKARELLKNTDLNISQIVYSIGFTSRSYFSKIFKEKYSISPNEFKKQLAHKVKIKAA